MEIIDDEHKVAMFLKIQFLEGKARRKLFEEFYMDEQLLQENDIRLKWAFTLRYERRF